MGCSGTLPLRRHLTGSPRHRSAQHDQPYTDELTKITQTQISSSGSPRHTSRQQGHPDTDQLSRVTQTQIRSAGSPRFRSDQQGHPDTRQCSRVAQTQINSAGSLRLLTVVVSKQSHSLSMKQRRICGTQTRQFSTRHRSTQQGHPKHRSTQQGRPETDEPSRATQTRINSAGSLRHGGGIVPKRDRYLLSFWNYIFIIIVILSFAPTAYIVFV